MYLQLPLSLSIGGILLVGCSPTKPETLGDAAGEFCLPNPQGDAGFACILDVLGGLGVVNAPCAFANARNPGLICVSTCDRQGGQFRVPLFDVGMSPPGAENIGVCGIPQ